MQKKYYPLTNNLHVVRHPNHRHQRPVRSSSPSTVNKSQPLCIIINDNATNQPREALTQAIRRTNSNDSSITTNRENEPPCNLASDPHPQLFSAQSKHPVTPPDPRQQNCSALACHLLSHIHHTQFKSTLEVQEWCQSHISVDILWKSNTISLMNTARTKLCRLCAAEQMTIGHNFVHSERSKKIINLKTEMRGTCICKTRFLRFLRSQ
jgi:hypothetical protein